jgi:hypothetical protein
MNPLSDGEDLALGPGEAYQRCMQVLAKPHPDYRAAQLFATLSLEETMRDAVAQLAQLTKELVIASRRR